MHITISCMDANGKINDNTIKAAMNASSVTLQTDMPAFKKYNIEYSTLDDIYSTAPDFDELVERSTDKLLLDDSLFIVLGDICSNRIAAELVRRVRNSGGSVSVIPFGDSALCTAFEAGFSDSTFGVSIFTVSSFSNVCDTDNTLVINEIDTRLCASELKLRLSKYYGDDFQLLLVDTRYKKGKKIPLCSLDCEGSYGYYTSIVLPSCANKSKLRYTFFDLVSIMDKLRSPGGCPWDREQTHESLKRYLIEEGYEVLEAIDEGDTEALYDELGDVLLQVVFHARIGEQSGEFDISDVTTAVCSKMISRHSHIFGDAVADTPEEVVQNWEQLKKAEKGQQSHAEVLLGVPKNMPALMRSEKVQAKAARAGMEFPGIADAVEKLKEELYELEQSISGNGCVEEECGDLLFSAVNISRLAGIEPETALQKAVDKFIKRFEMAERIALQKDIDMNTCGTEMLNDIWDKAKKQL